MNRQKGDRSSRLAGDEIDEGGHAGVPQALVDGRVVGGQLKDLQARKGGSQHRLSMEIFHLGGAASPIGQLLGPLALQQEQAPRFQGGLHLVEQNASQGGRGELMRIPATTLIWNIATIRPRDAAGETSVI